MSACNIGQRGSAEDEEGLLLGTLARLVDDETCAFAGDGCRRGCQGLFRAGDDLNLSLHAHKVEEGVGFLTRLRSLVGTGGEAGVALAGEMTADDAADITGLAQHLMHQLEEAVGIATEVIVDDDLYLVLSRLATVTRCCRQREKGTEEEKGEKQFFHNGKGLRRG